jgi:bla regulator protein blaR1
MKKFLLLSCIFVVALLTAVASLAQTADITGTWQGTLHAGSANLRTVIKISKADDGSLKAVFYSIDQGGQPLPVDKTTLQGSDLKMSMPAIGGSYEGKVSSDGNSISGTWSQGNPLPLDFARATPNTEWAIPAPLPPTKPMAADVDPSFEVATIKPSNPDTPGKGININRAREFTTRNTTFNDLITFAYGLHPKQLVGGPGWLDKDKFDILAKPDADGMPNDKQIKTMLQKLLADRFQLTFHREKQVLSVYAIVIGKDGQKLTPSGGDPNSLPGIGFGGGLGNLIVRNGTMADFAGFMQFMVMDKPVVDQTGLEGRFNFTLKWTPDEFQFPNFAGPRPQPPADTADAPPDLYTAIQQQLGLKIESTKAPADVLVIDKVSLPSPN